MKPPLVIAHRGFSGRRLEHTRPAYELAVEAGADFIEPDVVASRDGVLVVRHENEIGGTTDVADHPEFADRRTTKVVDGVTKEGWFSEDFTVAELKTLWAKERLPHLRPGNVALEKAQRILTFAEVLQIADQLSEGRDERVGVYVETKHPTYFEGVGTSLNDLLVADLAAAGRLHDRETTVIQSFETGNLRELRGRTGTFNVLLVSPKGGPADLVAAGDPRTYADLCTTEGLADVATYVDAIGPYKDLVIARDADGSLAAPTGLVERAHAAGLHVHVWTMRDENSFLPTNLRAGDDEAAHGDAVGEYLAFFDAGVDGLFSDFSSTAVQARSQWWAARP